MDNSFSSLIDSATSILVVLPLNPDFDTTSAGLSLYISLREKKETTIVSPSPITVGFNRLIGVNKIGSEIGSKNLTIKFAGYDATNIEKVSYDIENGEFKLTVIPKSGLNAPQKEQLDLTYAGANADLIILVGGADDSQFPSISSPDLAGVKIAHIGIRVLSSAHEVRSYALPGASVSELVANLIKENGLGMESDIATNLIMGVEEGSENFASPEVTPETFETFAYLLRSGGQRQPKVRLSSANFPPGSIPTAPFPMAQDIEGTQETEQEINPPDDWLQPKVFKGSANQPDSFSENKG